MVRIAYAGAHVALLSTMDRDFTVLLEELLAKHDPEYSCEIEESAVRKK